MADLPPAPERIAKFRAGDGTEFATAVEAYVHDIVLFLTALTEPDASPSECIQDLLDDHTDTLWAAVNAVLHIKAGRDPIEAARP